ncbi:MAG TPA: hypothetical protein VD862_01565 [Candidatus Paceibacterota bacterium]|nr:hypothetical protein [Candidatus Paceibacterota bacterium]
MPDDAYILTIGVPDGKTVSIEVSRGGERLAERHIPRGGAVDNELLTAVDNLFRERILDKFAQIRVMAGPGVDNNSILDKIILTLDESLKRARGKEEKS